nr:DNA-binding protein [Ramlibacter alkalitolerans]
MLVRLYEAAVTKTLVVRNVDREVVRALREAAARHGHSVEDEHRDILRQALMRPPRRALAEVLAEMPNVGVDEDFARARS